jgi:hypothetical protein
MLFAAGHAAGRPGPARFVWPALTGLLALVAVFLGAWLTVERNERLLLARQLEQSNVQRPAPESPLPPGAVPAHPSSAEERTDNSLLGSHRALEHGLDAWPAQAVVGTNTPDPPGDATILQVGHRDALLDP